MGSLFGFFLQVTNYIACLVPYGNPNPCGLFAVFIINGLIPGKGDILLILIGFFLGFLTFLFGSGKFISQMIGKYGPEFRVLGQVEISPGISEITSGNIPFCRPGSK